MRELVTRKWPESKVSFQPPFFFFFLNRVRVLFATACAARCWEEEAPRGSGNPVSSKHGAAVARHLPAPPARELLRSGTKAAKPWLLYHRHGVTVIGTAYAGGVSVARRGQRRAAVC